jgi:hypothetical protein
MVLSHVIVLSSIALRSPSQRMYVQSAVMGYSQDFSDFLPDQAVPAALLLGAFI